MKEQEASCVWNVILSEDVTYYSMVQRH